MNRVLAWFSCGSASAYAAKLAVEKYGDLCEVLYCDTLAHEHHDNRRFLADVERWVSKPIKILRSEEYTDIYDVFMKTRLPMVAGIIALAHDHRARIKKRIQRIAAGFTITLRHAFDFLVSPQAA